MAAGETGGRKKISLYLHPEAVADQLALDEVERVSRSKRGELYRQSLIAGLVLHRLDERLPGLLTALFQRDLSTDAVMTLLSGTTGWKPSQADILDVFRALKLSGCMDQPQGDARQPESAGLATARSKLNALI